MVAWYFLEKSPIKKMWLKRKVFDWVWRQLFLDFYVRRTSDGREKSDARGNNKRVRQQSTKTPEMCAWNLKVIDHNRCMCVFLSVSPTLKYLPNKYSIPIIFGQSTKYLELATLIFVYLCKMHPTNHSEQGCFWWRLSF